MSVDGHVPFDEFLEDVRDIDDAPLFTSYETRRSRKIPDHKDPNVWVTANGRKIPIRELGDRHLLNTVAFVERNYREMQDTFCDGALDMDRVWPQHAALVAEARRRGLVPKGNAQMVTA